MTSSRFWKEREEEFRRHANDENNSLAADWYSITDSWIFRGSSVGRSERVFKSLARKAARGLKGNLGADAWKSWLDALRDGEYGFELRFCHGGAYNQKRLDYLMQSGGAVLAVEGVVETVTLPDGSEETRTRVEGITGTIERVFETSADFCLELGCHTPPDATEEAQPDATGVILAQTLQRTRGASIEPAPAGGEVDLQRIMRAAMQQQGLNPPRLAVKMQAILKRTRQAKGTVDRTTVYRILAGKTKRPQPGIVNALIEALQLTEEDARIVHGEFCGRPPHPHGSRKNQKYNPQQTKMLN